MCFDFRGKQRHCILLYNLANSFSEYKQHYLEASKDEKLHSLSQLAELWSMWPQDERLQEIAADEVRKLGKMKKPGGAVASTPSLRGACGRRCFRRAARGAGRASAVTGQEQGWRHSRWQGTSGRGSAAPAVDATAQGHSHGDATPEAQAERVAAPAEATVAAAGAPAPSPS